MMTLAPSLEDLFVEALSEMESQNGSYKWGDSGRAAGRFQWHPSAYATWGPKPADFGGVERTWDWCFEWAVRKFFEAAITNKPEATPVQIAMAFHLHGQIRWDGWDKTYGIDFQYIYSKLKPSSTPS